jgi:AhpC/TSA family
MYPHERSLVEKYQDRPFVIIGVNSDASRDLVKQVSEKEKLTSRSFWDGGSTDGPIARRWNVNGWPTLYLIDHAGVIVRQVGAQDDELIEQKVKEAEAERKK